MSLLTGTLDDVRPQGRPLPAGTYRVTVESVTIEDKDGSTQLVRQYGSIRTRDGQTAITLPDGSIFQIGNRKLFNRDWIDHTNPEASRVGQSRIKQEAIAAGLMQKPTKEQPSTDLSFDSWESYKAALEGREVLVVVKQKTRIGKDKKPVLDENQQPIVQPEIAGWVTP